MKLATFNLNGIRARLPRLIEWLDREKPEIACLQELKCADESLPIAESVDSIEYDDDARKGPKFSFDAVEEEMTVLAHVGPEYSWQELENFLSSTKRTQACESVGYSVVVMIWIFCRVFSRATLMLIVRIS